MSEQFGAVFGAFGRMRRRRREGEYPEVEVDTPTVTRADAEEGIAQAEEMVEAARRLLETGELSPF